MSAMGQKETFTHWFSQFLGQEVWYRYPVQNTIRCLQQIRHPAVIFGLNPDAELGAKPPAMLHNTLAKGLALAIVSS